MSASFYSRARFFIGPFFQFSLLLAKVWLSYEDRILLHVIIRESPTSLKTKAINSNSSNDSWDEIGLCHSLRKLLQQVAGKMFGVRLLAVLKKKKNATSFNSWLPNRIYQQKRNVSSKVNSCVTHTKGSLSNHDHDGNKNLKYLHCIFKDQNNSFCTHCTCFSIFCTFRSRSRPINGVKWLVL